MDVIEKLIAETLPLSDGDVADAAAEIKYILARERSEKLEAALAAVHEKTRRVTLHEETILGGVRYAPGVYALTRIGDIDPNGKPEF